MQSRKRKHKHSKENKKKYLKQRNKRKSEARKSAKKNLESIPSENKNFVNQTVAIANILAGEQCQFGSSLSAILKMEPLESEPLEKIKQKNCKQDNSVSPEKKRHNRSCLTHNQLKKDHTNQTVTIEKLSSSFAAKQCRFRNSLASISGIEPLQSEEPFKKRSFKPDESMHVPPEQKRLFRSNLTHDRLKKVFTGSHYNKFKEWNLLKNRLATIESNTNISTIVNKW